MVTKNLRQEVLRRRRKLGEAERKLYSDAIVRRILDSKEFQEAQNIMLYRGVSDEVNLDALLLLEKEKGKTFSFPLCVTKKKMLAMIPKEGAWLPGSFGILEPDPRHSVEMEPATIDLVLTPLVAFDPACHRIGMGAGYYDRFLPQCKKAFFMAVAFEVQKEASIVPAPWDVPLDCVLTEAKRYNRLEPEV